MGHMLALSPMGKEEREKEPLFIERPLFAKLDWNELSLSYINTFNLHSNPRNRHYPTHFTDEDSEAQ